MTAHFKFNCECNFSTVKHQAHITFFIYDHEVVVHNESDALQWNKCIACMYPIKNLLWWLNEAYDH